jgi:hypothetical protein
MTVSPLVNTERPIILIYNPDQGRPDEYAEIEFKTQADANATQLNAIFKTATGIAPVAVELGREALPTLSR